MLADILHKIAGDSQEVAGKYYPRPSLAGPERCIRQLVYWGLDFPRQPLSGRAVTIFSDSSWHEELTADWIRQSAYQLNSQQMAVDCRPPMGKGYIDGIITDLARQDYLLEHKALNHFTFQRYADGDELPLDYLTQCAVYLDALVNINPDLTKGILLIKNKNTSAYMEYLVEYRREQDTLVVLNKVTSEGRNTELCHELANIVGDACKKFAAVAGYIAQRTLPTRPYQVDDWRCQYCAWGKTCWDGYEEEFAAMSTAAVLPDDAADMVRYYRELGAQKTAIEREYKELGNKIKQLLHGVGAREGRCGEYVCKLSLVRSERVDKALLSSAELDKATVRTLYEKLTIAKIQGG